MIVVIDGPAGSGKSSTAKAVTNRVGLQYLDSGALYRTLTLLVMDNAMDPDGLDSNVLKELTAQNTITFEYRTGTFHTYINGEDVTGRIRTQEVSDHVSALAAMPQARSLVNALMREGVKNRYFIADGRDLGTAVFPDADLKFYMVADVKVRAQRRLQELEKQGETANYDEVLANIRARDQKDSERAADPLKKPEDAVEINTSALTFDRQVEIISSHIDHYLKQFKLKQKPQP